MAKQNVGFGERHLEKFVVGVAGAVLAAMAFLFVVQDPYSVEVSGETLGPTSFYPRLDEQATQKLASLKNASPDSGSAEPPWKPPQQKTGATAEIPVVFAAVRPAVPQLDTGVGPRGQLELVQILAPGKPAVTTGRAYADLPEPEVKVLDSRQTPPVPPESTMEQPKDTHWTAVFASVPRSAQQEKFLAAGYAYDRSLLIVTNVEAERQRMLPGGAWGEPEPVRRTFSTVVLAGKRNVDLVRRNGDPEIDPVDYSFINTFRQEAANSQREILRPPLQSSLPYEAQLAWTVPAAMPDGSQFEWNEDYGVAIPLAEEAGVKEGAASPRFDYRKVKGEIDALVAQGEFIKADEKVQAALQEGGASLPVNQKKELDELAAQLQPKVQQQTLQREQERARREAIEQATLGANTDLLWLNDLSAVPGETYRYRVRLVVMNPHAGLIRKLKNPEDAAKVLLAGEWSDWSDPVLLKPDRYLFCLGTDGGQVKTELQQWTAGAWDKTNQTINLGQAVAFDDKLKRFTYPAVPALIEPTAWFEERTADPRRGIRYREPRETPSVVLVRDDGEVEEHLVLADVTQRRELQSEFAPPNRDLQRSMTPGQMPDGGGRPGMGYPPRGYPGRGGGRFRDEN